jgi:predicted RNA-binding Zn-ribbon protein involved in translation (DUF1610 family)
MSRSRKIDLEKVQTSLDKTCPKCGFTITPDQAKRVDFERIECPKCGEKFRAVAKNDLGGSWTPAVSDGFPWAFRVPHFGSKAYFKPVQLQVFGSAEQLINASANRSCYFWEDHSLSRTSIRYTSLPVGVRKATSSIFS